MSGVEFLSIVGSEPKCKDHTDFPNAKNQKNTLDELPTGDPAGSLDTLLLVTSIAAERASRKSLGFFHYISKIAKGTRWCASRAPLRLALEAERPPAGPDCRRKRKQACVVNAMSSTQRSNAVLFEQIDSD